MNQRHWLKTVIWGFIAGALAGLAMLLTMALLRLFLGWPTPTELIFDRVFPPLTVEFLKGEAKVLVRATDGEGQEQISEYRYQVPDGATGLHRVKARVEKT